MRARAKRGVEDIARISGLKGHELELYLERVEEAAGSPAALVSLEAQAGSDRVSCALRVAAGALRAESDGDPMPWPEDAAEAAARERAEVVERIGRMRSSGDAAGAAALEGDLAAVDAEGG